MSNRCIIPVCSCQTRPSPSANLSDVVLFKNKLGALENASPRTLHMVETINNYLDLLEFCIEDQKYHIADMSTEMESLYKRNDKFQRELEENSEQLKKMTDKHDFIVAQSRGGKAKLVDGEVKRFEAYKESIEGESEQCDRLGARSSNVIAKYEAMVGMRFGKSKNESRKDGVQEETGA